MRYVLLADGTSDRTLIPIINWLLTYLGVSEAIEAQWAETSPHSTKLTERISNAHNIYSADLMFIHRDAENQPYILRKEEISEAILKANISVKAICVIPIRMQEAWFLFDESSIREASG